MKGGRMDMENEKWNVPVNLEIGEWLGELEKHCPTEEEELRFLEEFRKREAFLLESISEAWRMWVG